MKFTAHESRVELDPKRTTWEGRPTWVRVDKGEWFRARVWYWSPTGTYSIEEERKS